MVRSRFSLRMTPSAPWDIVSGVLKLLREMTYPGANPKELNTIAESYVEDHGGTLINKGYTHNGDHPPYPNGIVICVNDEIAHGIAKDHPLTEGDIISYDVGVRVGNLCGDSALTVPVGEISVKDKKLIAVAKQALIVGISKVGPGVRIHSIGFAIEQFVKRQGYVVNRRFCGHTIGAEMHMDPDIPHFYNPRDDSQLVPGQMICLEPMITKHDSWGEVQADGWTTKTRDHEKSAFFEHQILVTETGSKILTTHI